MKKLVRRLLVKLFGSCNIRLNKCEKEVIAQELRDRKLYLDDEVIFDPDVDELIFTGGNW